MIGEAVKQLPEEVLSSRPDIEWRKISAMRNLLIHAYFGIDRHIVWTVVAEKIPGLVRAARELVALGGFRPRPSKRRLREGAARAAS